MEGGLQQLIHTFATSNEALAVILAAIVSGIGWLIVRALRARVGWSVSHGHAFNLPNPPNGTVLLYTKEIWVQNIGREVAEAIEIIFPAPPPHFDVWPLRIYEKITNPDNSFVVKLENLNPREHVTISLLQTGAPPPDVSTVRFRGGVGRFMQMGPQILLPRSAILLLQGLLLFGVFSLAYFVLILLL